MTLVVETGAGLANAESYVSVADCVTYAANRALTFPGTDVPASEASLRRATAYIDNTYRTRFTGYRTHRRAQALEWPRVGAYVYIPNNSSDMAYSSGYDPAYDYIQQDQIPIEIINATCEAAIRELASPGTLAPDLDRGNAVKLLKAGSVEIEYGANASATTTFQQIDLALSGLLRSDAIGIRAVRG
ncbi:hypothetical protein EN788_22245 [Mesorhizobium sp. M2D.F.Ca.ET.145.01.1.1]|uniref:DnaT-like ssDNA-binding protein n=1 Tax=unclassified Mesorhizobium TaxID=325217 RepID=UPI000FCA346A|nr:MULTISPECIES: DnaT-like ssDNA-binding protein [unclassified Mesorhizobium]TGU44639.1 hypothetical protein EN789_21795 [bacterium M00.F.Ca.ET.146.01.1.1]TGU58467.1 hypothetical protein EN791_021795 [Mesorhizobium sp. M2D.F.Ca.ET.148.01.1.1]TGU64399.1 hypothetical protein EN790_21790 [Mesorhizobium sp. M2D.F.Ca.ET.147.01.1.1]TGW09975.1 hypothetical protein EN788_22245 [Mesorhizobium sp. M2D.F.Ca.ET.145.01.1.1]